jgi:hypothetical protein
MPFSHLRVWRRGDAFEHPTSGFSVRRSYHLSYLGQARHDQLVMNTNLSHRIALVKKKIQKKYYFRIA